METLLLLAAASFLLVGLNISYGVSVSGGGVTINKSVVRTGDHIPGWQVALPAGTAGTLSTRTDDDTGVITAAGHALIVGDKVDVYWDGGLRYGMTVSAVAGNDITVGTLAGEIGAGDAFPVQATAVVITKQVDIVLALDGDNISLIAFSLEFTQTSETSKGHIDLQDSGDLTIEEIDLTANQAIVYDIDGGAANVFTGNPITNAHASNGSSSNAATLKIVAAVDSTP